MLTPLRSWELPGVRPVRRVRQPSTLESAPPESSPRCSNIPPEPQKESNTFGATPLPRTPRPEGSLMVPTLPEERFEHKGPRKFTCGIAVQNFWFLFKNKENNHN